MKHVLLVGKIGPKKANRLVNLVHTLHHGDELILTVDCDGGFLSPTLRMLSTLCDIQNRGVRIRTRILRAESMSAVLALRAGPLATRTMAAGGFLHLHLGGIELQYGEWDLETRIISESVNDQYKEYKKILDEILDQYKISSSTKAMAELYGHNWLKVPAQQCLELGMVSELF